ncbi:hypothetical protein N752_00945 [Desulforamulus aquiferis]|nr:helix-turn-helix transcriptional regulator [Desulforamulus aquiferis]RYD07182.1 hypothetical protein N752_00945 [Desulforamulus aquiferis]
MDISLKIVQLREQKGYSTNKLAKIAGVGQSTLREIEIGQKQPTVYTLDKICYALGISLAEFFAEDSNDFPLSSSTRSLAMEMQNLHSAQVDIIKNIINEFSLINQKVNQETSNEILDLLTSKSKPLTLAGKPIDLEERVRILEALRDILPQDGTENEDDEVLVANFEGKHLYYMPTPEEAEEIEKAIEAAMKQKKKDQNKNNETE